MSACFAWAGLPGLLTAGIVGAALRSWVVAGVISLGTALGVAILFQDFDGFYACSAIVLAVVLSVLATSGLTQRRERQLVPAGRGVMKRQPVPGRCDWCGYDTSGLIDSACPECGNSGLRPRTGEVAHDMMEAFLGTHGEPVFEQAEKKAQGKAHQHTEGEGH